MPSPRTDLPALGARLRAARLNAGMSQDALAQKMGVRQNAVSRWETGVDLDASSLRRLLEAIGLPRSEWGDVLALAGVDP